MPNIIWIFRLYIEVDVQEGGNSLIPVNKIFMAFDSPKIIVHVMAPDNSGSERWCAVTGWSSSGPSPAYTVLVEDSGEGVVTLVYGSDQGIRLKDAQSQDPWDLDNPNQWGEACLLLDQYVMWS